LFKLIALLPLLRTNGLPEPARKMLFRQKTRVNPDGLILLEQPAAENATSMTPIPDFSRLLSPAENKTSTTPSPETAEEREHLTGRDYVQSKKTNLIVGSILVGPVLILLGVWACSAKSKADENETDNLRGAEDQDGSQKTVAEVMREVGLQGSENNEALIRESLFLKRLDARMSVMCAEPSIFVVMFATRAVCLDQFLVAFISILMQVALPLLLLPDLSKPKDLFPKMPNVLVALAWPLILVFTFVTIKGAIERVLAMWVLASGRGYSLGSAVTLPLYAGIVAISCSIIATISCTSYLFYESPRIQDMLLNSVAVNFLPETDKLLVHTLGVLSDESAQHYALAMNRLQRLEEVWPGSNDRKDVLDWSHQTTYSQFRSRPFLFLGWVFEQFIVAVILIGSWFMGVRSALRAEDVI